MDFVRKVDGDAVNLNCNTTVSEEVKVVDDSIVRKIVGVSENWRLTVRLSHLWVSLNEN